MWGPHQLELNYKLHMRAPSRQSRARGRHCTGGFMCTVHNRPHNPIKETRLSSSLYRWEHRSPEGQGTGTDCVSKQTPDLGRLSLSQGNRLRSTTLWLKGFHTNLPHGLETSHWQWSCPFVFDACCHNSPHSPVCARDWQLFNIITP